MTSGSRSAPSTLLHRFDRTFRVWHYGVGHSHLLLRSRKDGVEDTRLDLHFEAVDSMRLVTRYEDLELHTVDDSEFSRVYEESGVPQRWRDTRLVVRLRSRSGTGYVQCGRVVADRHQDDEGVPAVRDVVWSLRPSGLRTPVAPAGDAEAGQPAAEGGTLS
ncbi:hypothetical protein [Streptomyces atroolivaceus]|uniref:hypothetical protein n=1 Tax=Streptomyces atroolivaceus TaxID=66869 RepID=UPI0020245838|nr:hypothetical protein [Streptomyces atroolivaceus]